MWCHWWRYVTYLAQAVWCEEAAHWTHWNSFSTPHLLWCWIQSNKGSVSSLTLSDVEAGSFFHSNSRESHVKCVASGSSESTGELRKRQVVLTSGHVADLSSSYVSTSCEEPSKLRDEEDHTGQQQMCVKTHMQELFSLSAYNQSRVTGISEIYFTNPDTWFIILLILFNYFLCHIIKVKAKPVALLVSL